MTKKLVKFETDKEELELPEYVALGIILIFLALTSVIWIIPWIVGKLSVKLGIIEVISKEDE